MTIVADYKPGKGTGTGTGNIIVKRPGTTDRIISTSELLNIDFSNLDATGFSTNNNDAAFIIEQKRLRILDMMKDGKVAKGSNISGSIYGIMYGSNGPHYADAFDRLKEIEHKFDRIMDPKMTPYSWTKISKNSSLNPLLPKKVVFKESGLDGSYFIEDPVFCGNFANEVIDPAGRSPIDLPKDTIFPGNNEELELSEDFLRFFGFDNCRVLATRQPNGAYAFRINLPGIPEITTNPMNMGAGLKIDWFQGNVQKNNFIAADRRATPAIKKGLLLTKEMGDVLQVLIMFLWKLLNNTPGSLNYTMVTCDKVVMLQCILLNLNCVLTQASKDSGIKLRQIYEFRPITDPTARATEEFLNEKRKILEQNEKFISGFVSLRDRPNTNIYMAGETNPFTFTPQFYESIRSELTELNRILDATFPLPGTVQPKVIRELTENMKKNFLFNLFIRKPKDQLKMTLAKKYTEKDDMWKGQFQSQLPGYGKDPFYQIAKSKFKKTQGGGIQTGGGEDLSLEDKTFEFLEFDEMPAMYHDEETYNLYEHLNNNIDSLLQQKDLAEYSDSFYNELYFKFYLNNAVLYDDELSKLIDSITNEDFVFPTSLTNDERTFTFNDQPLQTQAPRQTIGFTKTNLSLLAPRNYLSGERSPKRKLDLDFGDNIIENENPQAPRKKIPIGTYGGNDLTMKIRKNNRSVNIDSTLHRRKTKKSKRKPKKTLKKRT